MNDRIIKLLKERLDIGAKKYGHENIISDDRNFTQEALEEVLDCMVYAACKLLEIKDLEGDWYETKDDKSFRSSKRFAN